MSTCAFLFCNNLLTKCTAWAQAAFVQHSGWWAGFDTRGLGMSFEDGWVSCPSCCWWCCPQQSSYSLPGPWLQPPLSLLLRVAHLSRRPQPVHLCSCGCLWHPVHIHALTQSRRHLRILQPSRTCVSQGFVCKWSSAGLIQCVGWCVFTRRW